MKHFATTQKQERDMSDYEVMKALAAETAVVRIIDKPKRVCPACRVNIVPDENAALCDECIAEHKQRTEDEYLASVEQEQREWDRFARRRGLTPLVLNP